MKTKIAMALLLSVIMTSFSLTVNAEETEGNITTVSSGEIGESGTTREAEVVYTQTSSFMVSIPKSIVLDGETKTAEYSINVKGDIMANKVVVVAPTDMDGETDGINFVMSEESDAAVKKDDVIATVVQEQVNWTYTEASALDAESNVVGTTKTGSITAEDLSSGVWSGICQFDISIIDAQ